MICAAVSCCSIFSFDYFNIIPTTSSRYYSNSTLLKSPDFQGKISRRHRLRCFSKKHSNGSSRIPSLAFGAAASQQARAHTHVSASTDKYSRAGQSTRFGQLWKAAGAPWRCDTHSAQAARSGRRKKGRRKKKKKKKKKEEQDQRQQK